MAIDKKYFKMLKSQHKSALELVAKDLVEEIITYAICSSTGNEFPGDKFTTIHIGSNAENGRRSIMADNEDKGTRGIVEFSNNYRVATLIGKVTVDVQLDEETALAVKQIFTSSEEELYNTAIAYCQIDPFKKAAEEFDSEPRYGSKEEVLNEFLDIYKKYCQIALSGLSFEEDTDHRAEDAIKTAFNAKIPVDIEDIEPFVNKNNIYIVR